MKRICIILLFMCSFLWAQDKKWSPDWKIMGDLKVQYIGHTVTWDFYATGYLRYFSGKDHIVYKEQKISALQWLTLSIFEEEESQQYPFFFIKNLDVASQLGLEEHHKKNKGLYSFHLLQMKRDILIQKAEDTKGIEQQKQTAPQQEMLDLYNKFSHYQSLRNTFALFKPLKKFIENKNANFPQTEVSFADALVSLYASPKVDPAVNNYFNSMWGKYYSDTFPIIATTQQDKSWVSPWHVFYQSFRHPKENRTLLNHLQLLYQAFHNKDAASFSKQLDILRQHQKHTPMVWPQPQPTTAEAKKHFENALQHFQNDVYDNAISESEKAAQMAPSQLHYVTFFTLLKALNHKKYDRYETNHIAYQLIPHLKKKEDALSMFFLGRIYLYLTWEDHLKLFGGELRDQAIKYFTRASELQQPLAMYHMGNYYLEGDGVKKDHTKAFEWFHKSAQTGCIWGMLALAQNSKTIDEKLMWYKKAVDNGSPGACMTLGGMYFEGKEVKKDLTEAKKWLTKAHELGDPNAAAYIKYVESLQKPQQQPKNTIDSPDSQYRGKALATKGRRINFKEFTLEIPKGWTQVPPGGISMAEFTLDAHPKYSVRVIHFGEHNGDVASYVERNVQRWKKKFTPLQKEEILPLKNPSNILMYFEGTYFNNVEEQKGQATLAGIIIIGQKLYFFTLHAPKEIVVGQIQAFTQFLDSYKK